MATLQFLGAAGTVTLITPAVFRASCATASAARCAADWQTLLVHGEPVALAALASARQDPRLLARTSPGTLRPSSWRDLENQEWYHAAHERSPCPAVPAGSRAADRR